MSVVKGFSIEQKILQLKSKTVTQPLTFNGRCEATTDRIEMSLIQNVFVVPSASEATITNNCALQGTWSITLVFSSSAPFQIPTDQPYKEIFFRARTSFGYSEIKAVRLQLKDTQHFLTSGSSIYKNPSNNNVLKSRVLSVSKTTLDSGSVLTSRIKIK